MGFFNRFLDYFAGAPSQQVDLYKADRQTQSNVLNPLVKEYAALQSQPSWAMNPEVQNYLERQARQDALNNMGRAGGRSGAASNAARDAVMEMRLRTAKMRLEEQDKLRQAILQASGRSMPTQYVPPSQGLLGQMGTAAGAKVGERAGQSFSDWIFGLYEKDANRNRNKVAPANDGPGIGPVGTPV